MFQRGLASRMDQRLPFLGGAPLDQLEDNKLPSEAEVLRRLHGKSGNASGAIRAPRSLSCRLDNKPGVVCSRPGGCLENNAPCFFYEVKQTWPNLPIVSDYRVMSKLDKLHTRYVAIKKVMHRFNEEKEEAIVKELEKTFDISKEGWREVIEEDNVLSREEKQEKIQVLQDYLEDGGTRYEYLTNVSTLSENCSLGAFLCTPRLRSRRRGPS